MAPAACAGAWLSLMLDEVDYGMVLLDVQAQVLHANQAARTEFESEHPLQLLAGGGLRARQGQHELRLRDALAGARRGRRTLLSLDDAGRALSVAVIPLDGHGEVGATLLLMGKRRTCTMPTLQGFADCHGLTAAETRVLAGLCAGTASARSGPAAWREPGHGALTDQQHARQDWRQKHPRTGAAGVGAAAVGGRIARNRLDLVYGSAHRQCTASA